MAMVKKSLCVVAVTITSCPCGAKTWLGPWIRRGNDPGKFKELWLKPVASTVAEIPIEQRAEAVATQDYSTETHFFSEDNARFEFSVVGDEHDDLYSCAIEMEVDNVGVDGVFEAYLEDLLKRAGPSIEVARARRRIAGGEDPAVVIARLVTVWSHETWVEKTEDGDDVQSYWDLLGVVGMEQLAALAEDNEKAVKGGESDA